MRILNIVSRNGCCTVTTPEGRFERWPGRTIASGLQWWSFAPAGGGRHTVVTVPDTIHTLEAEHLADRGPAISHLRLVKGAA